MVRISLAAMALGVLVACQPVVPDSAAGVGFDTEAAKTRDDLLARTPGQTTVPAPQPVQTAALDAPAAPAVQNRTGTQSSRIAAPGVSPNPTVQPLPASVTAAVTGDDAVRETSATRQAAAANSGVSPVVASPSNPAPVQVSNPGISSEQDFGAVSSQRSIENDAQRIATNRAQYQVISPTSLPTREGTNQPNIVEYALRTNNPVGAQIYRRTNLRSAARRAAACAGFASPDQAQIEFLSKGGPQRDRKGLDPDGDGFACSWDPRPFRSARGAVAATNPAVPLAISNE